MAVAGIIPRFSLALETGTSSGVFKAAFDVLAGCGTIRKRPSPGVCHAGAYDRPKFLPLSERRLEDPQLPQHPETRSITLNQRWLAIVFRPQSRPKSGRNNVFCTLPPLSDPNVKHIYIIIYVIYAYYLLISFSHSKNTIVKQETDNALRSILAQPASCIKITKSSCKNSEFFSENSRIRPFAFGKISVSSLSTSMIRSCA
jgi:hypothetical protein